MNLNDLSPMNNLRARSVVGEPAPEVGMGATLLVGSDRYGCTIHGIFKDGGRDVLVVTHDDSKLVAGSVASEEQDYEYTPRPDGQKMYFVKDARGFWQEMEYKVFEYGYDEEKDERTIVRQSKRLSKVGSRGLQIGTREEYRDPTF